MKKIVLIMGFLITIAMATQLDIKLLDQKCNSGDINACNSLGRAYFFGDKVAKDYTKAAKLFSKACDGNNANACYNLGVLYESGKDGKSLAIKYYDKGCKLGDSQSCAVYNELNR